MLISPPFLISNSDKAIDAAEAGDSIVPDNNVCAVGMQECAPGNGAFPVSYSLGWHGGVHLIAPRDAQGQAVPVRAIADGTVVYARQNSGESEALSYRGVRTDDGCVVIKHETEIGDGASAKVIFFSIYMHLQTVLSSVTAGKKIYRKDKLGVAGEIYGQMGQTHFEIVCDSANLKKLVGRDSGPLAAETGRKDAIYGDIWFTVPTGAPIFANQPHPYRLDDEESAPGPSIQPQEATLTTRDLVIRMRFELGACTLTTYKTQDDGGYVEVGSSCRDQEYEYNLYKEANRLNARYAEMGADFTVAPAPSAIYEMLRFGRIVGPDALPANGQFGHWRKIECPDGTGWINLSSSAVSAVSDADFPHWTGWSLIDDDGSADSLCDSPTIKRWLDLDDDGQVTHAEAVTALHSPVVRDRMSKAICKFPIEWSKTGIDERWGWLNSSHEALPLPLSEDDFTTLKTHIEALAFWEDAQANEAALPAATDCWHLPPTAFIEHFRKCGWLSPSEIAQCLPRSSLSGSVTWNTALQRGTIHARPINLIYRKYLNESKVRLLHFLAQAYIETGLLRTVKEDNLGVGHSYGAFYGRGYLQLTWASNYEAYGLYRRLPNQGQLPYADARITATSTHLWSDGVSSKKWAPRFDPSIVGTDLIHGAESSAMYWLAKTFRRTHNMNRAADLGTSPLVVAFISWLVNGGGNGYANRQQFAALLNETLFDQPRRGLNEVFSYPPLTPPGRPIRCSTFPPTPVTSTLSVSVSYELQIP